MIRFLSLSLSTAVLLAGIAAAQSKTVGPSDEEYCVYDAVLREMLARGKVNFNTTVDVKLVVIREDTISDSREHPEWNYFRQRLGTPSDEVIKDYISKPKNVDKLTRRLGVNIEQRFLSEEKAKKVFTSGDEGWKQFYTDNSGSSGYIGFSRVGFGKGGKEALVFLEHWCGSTCGTGHYVLLRKMDNCWNVESVAMSWIS